MVVQLGFGTASTRLVAREPESSARVGLNAMVFALLVGCVGAGALFLFFPEILDFVRGRGGGVHESAKNLPLGLSLALCMLPLLVLDSFLFCVLIGMGKILQANLAKAIQAASFVVFLPLLFSFSGETVASAISARLASFALGNLLLFYALARVWRGPRRCSSGLAKGAFRFGLQVWPAALALFLLFRVDIALMRWFRPVAEVGIYAVASSLALMFQLLGYAVERAMVPRLMSRSAEETADITPLATRCWVLISLPISLVVALVAWPAVPFFYGTGYVGAVLPFVLFLPGLVVGNIGQICNADLIGRGRPEWSVRAAVLALALNLGMNWFLIPAFGMVGAALSSLICYSVYGLVLAWGWSLVAARPLRNLLLPRRQDFSILRAALLRKKNPSP